MSSEFRDTDVPELLHAFEGSLRSPDAADIRRGLSQRRRRRGQAAGGSFAFVVALALVGASFIINRDASELVTESVQADVAGGDSSDSGEDPGGDLDSPPVTVGEPPETSLPETSTTVVPATTTTVMPTITTTEATTTTEPQPTTTTVPSPSETVAAPTTTPSPTTTTTTTEAPVYQLPDVAIVNVRGIQVAEAIADDVEALLAAAEADGLVLEGWGFRDQQLQVELRQLNCGTSDYDIFERPPEECSIPTALPGMSLHEMGLAIDFTNTAARNSETFIWLSQNAASFGFFNRPSEPWHWSTTGE